MGLSILAVIFNIIQSVYDIDSRINQLYREKREMSRWTTSIGKGMSKAAGLGARQKMRVRLIDFSNLDKPTWSTQYYTNQFDPGGKGVIVDTDINGSVNRPGCHPGVVWSYNPAFSQDQSQPEFVLAPEGQLATDPNGNPLTEGEMFMSKEEAEALFKVYLSQMKEREAEIDMELETLKATKQALVSQREEFQKYIAENIKKTFTNPYMA